MTHYFEMAPQDVLFFKDARPMEASDVGLGANWPRPDQLYHALKSSLLTNWPERQDWENTGENRFNALKVAGPFPQIVKDSSDRKAGLYWPCPLDWGMKLVASAREGSPQFDLARTDLPKPLTHAFLSRKEGKVAFPKWISTQSYLDYLRGNEGNTPPKPVDLYDVDRLIGIAMESTQRTVREGAFYQAEYLRLHDDVKLTFMADCLVRSLKGNETDVFTRRDLMRFVRMGGQGRSVILDECEKGFLFPELDALEVKTPYLRWTLLTPAIFNSGWLPGWIGADTGKVHLRRVCEPRRIDETRKNWKLRCSKVPEVEAKLIAARIGKELAFSGWRVDERNKGPKPTVFAVPAGSSYVFDCGDCIQAARLAQVLRAPNRHSDLCGERGFGLGVCSSVEIEEVENN